MFNRTNRTAKAANALLAGTNQSGSNAEPQAYAPVLLEQLEGRELMSVTPVGGPAPCQMQNVIVTSVTQPPPAGVALLGLIVG